MHIHDANAKLCFNDSSARHAGPFKKVKLFMHKKSEKSALMYFVRPSYTSYVEHSKWLHADGQIVLQTVGVPNLIWYNSISIECKERKKIGILKEAIFLHKSTTYLQIVVFSNNIYVT